MRVTAMLLWFDEPPELLRQAVRGAAVIADKIVAADGAYELVDDKAPESPPEQKQAIEDECSKLGLDLVLMEPRIYAGQVDKRNEVLQVAMEGSDWVFPVDADWLITGEREAIREELEALHANGYQQVCVDFIQPDNSDGGEEKFANVWHIGETGQERQLPLLYRVMPTMNYRREHWSIEARDEDGFAYGLWGGAARETGGKTGFLQATHLFQHLCLYREEKQIERNRDYIVKRDAEVARVGYET